MFDIHVYYYLYTIEKQLHEHHENIDHVLLI